jgi:cardiolipin synthase
MNDLLGFFINTQSAFNLRLILLIHFLLVTYFIGVIISVARDVTQNKFWILFL